MIPAAMPKTLVGISVSMLIVAAVFGVLNSVRVKGLYLDLANAIAARDAAEHGRMAQAKEFKSRQTKIPGTSAKSADAESKAAKVEADLAKVQNESRFGNPVRGEPGGDLFVAKTRRGGGKQTG